MPPTSVLKFKVPLPPTTPPDDLTLTGMTTETSCIDEVQEGGEVAAGLVGLDDATREIADDEGIMMLGDPVFYAPVAIAYDRSGPDPASLEVELGAALEELRADGTLAERSVARFDGLDLTQVPDGGPIGTPPPGDAPAFGVDDTLASRFPTAIGDVTLAPVFLSGADLDLLLRPSNASVSRTYRGFQELGAGTDPEEHR